MKISQLEDSLKAIKETHGDLDLLIERPTGVFVELSNPKIKYVLCHLQKENDDGYTYTVGKDFLILSPLLYEEEPRT